MGMPEHYQDASPTPATSTTTTTATAAAGAATAGAPAGQPPHIREQAASPSPPPPRGSSQGPGTGANVDYRLPKNRSTGNLLSHVSHAPRTITGPDGARQRFSFDASAFESMSQSPIIPEHEHGLGASGLRRIRQQHPARLPGISTTATTSRSTSMNLSLPASRHSSTSLPSGPGSPTLNFSEDLTRFPSESLHSFSFAHQSEESIHNRQNVLKRSIDFMRDKLGWAASNPGIANAQAKLSGDQEVQSMMELLSRAHLIGGEAMQAHGLGAPAPITGPPDMSGDNIFDKSFTGVPRSASPVHMEGGDNARDPIQTDIDASMSDTAVTPTTAEYASIAPEASAEKPAAPQPTRASLKRTLTDTAPLDIQSKLTDAMARPYITGESYSEHHMINAGVLPSVSQVMPAGHGSVAGAPHGHGQRWTPAAQAIFTTEAQAPWTITAANDLACLVFGVTRAEVRRLGILEVVREERRKWLEEKLKDPDSGSSRKGSLYSHSQRTSPNPTTTLNVGNGVTARLLSKPSSRQQPKRRAKTDDGAGSSYARKNKAAQHHHANKSRGVLLCGDVVPIQKRNGAVGSASLWVKEKKGGLIWVLEEIAEDVVYVSLDEVGCVTNAHGAIEPIWGFERIRRGMDIQRLIPDIPRIQNTHTGALDYDAIGELRTFTARTSNSISIPITVEPLTGEPTFRISSFPHIAGILVLNANTLQITSSNSVFSSALFGQPRPDGLNISELIPGFDRILQLMTDEDKIQLVDGIVIPEHSFRRARALLAMRDGSRDAAAVFLRPSGLPAKHRDGAEIMVDVQMRVVKSEKKAPEKIEEDVIVEDLEGEAEAQGIGMPHSEVVYALWITYSRHLHAASSGAGPVTPIATIPGSPLKQPSPGQSVIPSTNGTDTVVSLLSQQLAQEVAPPTPVVVEAPRSSATTQAVERQDGRRTKSINDFVVLEDMGQGAYGQVKLCRYKKDREKKMVIKYVTKRRILVDTWTRDRKLGTVPLEIHVLDFLRRPEYTHVNIVEMADFFEDEVNYYIEMIPHGLPGMDLFDYIELRVNMDEAECRKLFVQVARAVEHLHITAKVVHRDIKDENIILDGEGRVKLIDFGSAAYIKSGPFDVFVGTIDYAAPEVLRGLSYRGKEQDVWALGILLYTIVYKENPFYSIDEIMDHDLRVPYVLSEESIDLIRRMLDRDVEQRITISQVLEHEWCKGEGSGWNEATQTWEWPC